MAAEREKAKKRARQTKIAAAAARTTLAARVERVLVANPQPLTALKIMQLLDVQGSAATRTDVEAVLVSDATRFTQAGSHPTTYVRVGEPMSSTTADNSTAKVPRLWAPASRQPGLPQTGWRPSFDAAPFRMSWLPLPEGPVGEMTWGVALARLQATVEGFDYDELVLKVPVKLSAELRDVVEVHIERVVAEKPFWVAWLVSHSAPLLVPLFDCGWHLWSVLRPAAWSEPAHLRERDAATGGPRLVATWRADSPHVLSRALLGTLHDVFGMRRVDSLVLDVVRPGAQEVARRQRELERHEFVGAELVRRGFTGFKNPVRGMCALCGRPLRDPASHRRGIGPVCWDLVRDLKITSSDMRSDVPAEYWVGAQPEQQWRGRLAARLSALDAVAKSV